MLCQNYDSTAVIFLHLWKPYLHVVFLAPVKLVVVWYQHSFIPFLEYSKLAACVILEENEPINDTKFPVAVSMLNECPISQVF